MSEPRVRISAAVVTAIGLIAGGFDAHLAPQADGWWHGFTGSPSLHHMAMALLAGALILQLGTFVSVRPLWGMAFGLLPLVPATTGLGSPLLFFSGYTMIVLFAILLGVACGPLIRRMPPMEPLAVTLIAFAFFILVGRFLPGPAGPQGDEPHYLLISESLIRDGDLDLKNQFDERAFSKFTSAVLEPHKAPRSPEGKLYAIHTPGLSTLIAPGYALLGFSGARAVVSAAMALTVGLLYASMTSLLGPSAAGFVFLLATFSSPLPIYANSLYPDSVATLPVAATLACMISSRPALLALSSVGIATLPWLHPRFLPLALLLAVCVSLSGRSAIRRALAVGLPLLLSVGLLLSHFRATFGSATLSAAYGPGFGSDVSVLRIPWGASALILDRQFGLLLFAPVLLAGLVGARRLWIANRSLAFLCLAVFGVQLGVGGSFSMWWGGATAPARFLIAAVPALLVVCGAAWRSSETQPDRQRLLGAASGFGAGLLLLACLAPRALHNRSDGESGLLRLLSPVLDMDRFFPGFVNGRDLWLASVWGVVLIASIVKPRAGFFAGVLPIAFATLSSPTPLLNPFSASLRALESWHDDRRVFGGDDAEAAFNLEIPLGASSWNLEAGDRRYSPRFSLPAGLWTLRVESESESTPGALNLARVSVLGSGGDEARFASVTVRASEKFAVVDFELVRSQQRVNLRGDGLQARARILSVRLTPRIRSP